MKPRFVGRAAELGELLTGFETALAGDCVVSLVAGEPGVGKTRLSGTVHRRRGSQGGEPPDRDGWSARRSAPDRDRAALRAGHPDRRHQRGNRDVGIHRRSRHPLRSADAVGTGVHVRRSRSARRCATPARRTSATRFAPARTVPGVGRGVPPRAARRRSAYRSVRRSLLLSSADLHVVSGGGAASTGGSVQLYLGAAALGAGRPDAAVRHLRAAVAANETAGLAPFAAMARFRLAAALRARGRPTSRAAARSRPGAHAATRETNR